MSQPIISFDPTDGPKIFLRSPDGTLEEELYLQDDGTLSIGNKNFKLNGSNEISVTFTDSQRPYIRRTSSTYGVMAYILFSGTTELGDAASINALAWSKSASKNYSLKIIRHDTGDQLCELTDQNNSDIEIKDLGTITNLPTTPTILEIHGKCDNGGECRISSVLIKF